MTTTPAMPDLTAVIKWLENGCDPREAVKELKHYQSKLQALATLQAQPAAPGVTGAVQTLIEALKADPEYAWAWHCNVAMAAVDEGLSHYQANKAAARFLSLLAQIDTTKHPGFPKAPEQPAAAGVSDAEIDRVCYLATEIRFAKTDDAAQAVIDQIRAILALRPQAVPMTDEKAEALIEDLSSWASYVDVDHAFQTLDTHVRQTLESHGITAPAGGEG